MSDHNQEKKGLSSKIKSLDIYRKVPSEITEPTVSGACVSIFASIIIFVLLISEFSNYNHTEINSEMFVDGKRSNEKLRVNLNIILHRLPCDILSIDVQDTMGTHQVNVGGEMMKKRLNKDGSIISQTLHQNSGHDHGHSGHNHDQSHNMNIGHIQKALDEEEGCEFHGFLLVNKVPGNFHISSHAYGQILAQVLNGKHQTLDLSHTIKHLSFGNDDYYKKVKSQFPNQGNLNPLDGVEKIHESKGRRGYFYTYYLSIVPTYYDTFFSTYNLHQFTANSHEQEQGNLPAIFFKFDFSSVAVKYYQNSNNFFHFLVQVCAIIGGVFIIARFLDFFIHKMIISIFKINNDLTF